MIIVENPDACTGCLRCELACAYHHTRSYSRSHSSIIIDKDILNPNKGTTIKICQEPQNQHSVCDLCKDETGLPLCILFCPERVLKGGNDAK